MTVDRRPGLREVIAGQTHICKLDEQISRVFIYGYSLEELIEHHSYEETAYLTLYGELPPGGRPVFDPPNATQAAQTPIITTHNPNSATTDQPQPLA